MTAGTGTPVPLSRSSKLASGLHVLRWLVLGLVALDLLTNALPYLGYQGLGETRAWSWVQTPLAMLACAAFMWRRYRWALLPTAVLLLLEFTVRPSGSEAWVVLVSAVMLTATLSRLRLALALLGFLAYAIALGVLLRSATSTRDMLMLTAVAIGVGLAARWGLRLRDRANTTVEALTEENARIREDERTSLARELRSIVTAALDRIEHRIAGAEHHRDADALRADLDRIDADCRTALTELRSLLAILRADPAEATTEHGPAEPAGHDGLSVRWFARAALVVLGALTTTMLFVTVTHYSATAVVITLGLASWTLSFLRPVLGWLASAVTIAVAVTIDPNGYWPLLASILFIVLLTIWCGQRRIWIALVGVAGLAALTALTDHHNPPGHAIAIAGFGLVALLPGLAVRHFRDDRDSTLGELSSLEAEQSRITAQERGAVARELHDVVAHQLSLTTMLIMATSLSTDPVKLRNTLAEVRTATSGARDELADLLRSMGDAGPGAEPALIASPDSSARELATQLTRHGFRTVVEVDPAADELDPTTRRTLIRVMQEATTNILRYGDTRDPSRYLLVCRPDQVQLTISNALPPQAPRRSDLSLGYGLRGLRERVDLTHGTFDAHPSEGRWQVAVTLPRAPQLPPTATPADQPEKRTRTASPWAGRSSAADKA